MCWFESFQYVYYQKNMINKVIYLLSIFFEAEVLLCGQLHRHMVIICYRKQK